MATMTRGMARTTKNQSKLDAIQTAARKRHNAARLAAKRRGRHSFPELPFECTWAFESAFDRKAFEIELELVYLHREYCQIICLVNKGGMSLKRLVEEYKGDMEKFALWLIEREFLENSIDGLSIGYKGKYILRRLA